jgi:hypothetical protein
VATNDVDELVLFPDVRIVKSTAPALLCRIGDKDVWLPRLHVSGKLWCTGDRGKLFIRRWVARDRRLIGPRAVATVSSITVPLLAEVSSQTPSIPPRYPPLRLLPVRLHLARRDRSAHAD